MDVFEQSKSFPSDERFSLTDQMRRSSRSVAANISEAWRKRRYQAAFVSKLSDAETEMAESQTDRGGQAVSVLEQRSGGGARLTV